MIDSILIDHLPLKESGILIYFKVNKVFALYSKRYQNNVHLIGVSRVFNEK